MQDLGILGFSHVGIHSVEVNAYKLFVSQDTSVLDQCLLYNGRSIVARYMYNKLMNLSYELKMIILYNYLIVGIIKNMFNCKSLK